MELYSACFDWLLAEGLIPKMEEDHRILFKYQRRTFVLLFDPQDPAFVRLVLPGVFGWEKSESVILVVGRVLNLINIRFKLVKAFVDVNVVSMGVELLIDDSERSMSYLGRAMDVLIHSHQEFYQLFQQLEQEGDCL